MCTLFCVLKKRFISCLDLNFLFLTILSSSVGAVHFAVPYTPTCTNVDPALGVVMFVPMPAIDAFNVGFNTPDESAYCEDWSEAGLLIEDGNEDDDLGCWD